MAHPVSSFESHPMRAKVVDAIIAHQTLQQIASWLQPKVSEATLCRWRMKVLATSGKAQDAVNQAIANIDKGLPQAAREVASRAAIAASIDPFIARVEELRRERQAVKDACLQSLETPDLGTWAKLDGNDLKELEIHAKLAGRYNDGSQTTINIVVPMTAQPAASEPADIEIIDIRAIKD
jgi:hypothetical protein